MPTEDELQSEREQQGEFEVKWQEMVQKKAEIARLQEDIQGVYADSEREPPTLHEQEEFLEGLSEFLQEASTRGKTVADFNRAVKEAISKDSEKIFTKAEKDFYQEAQAEVDSNYPPRKLKRHFYKYIIRNGVPELLNARGKDKKLKKNLHKLLELYYNLDAANMVLGAHKDELKALKKELSEEMDTEVEEEIRDEIHDLQRSIAEQVEHKTGIEAKMRNKRKIANDLTRIIKMVLRKEAQKISVKFGGKINGRFMELKSLQEELSKYDPLNPEHDDKRNEIQEEIETADIALSGLKKDLIKYKAKNWIFHFEKFFGVISNPLIYTENKQTSPIALARLERGLGFDRAAA